MSNWRYEMESALAAFVIVAELAGESIQLSELTVEYLEATHRQPSILPTGKVAIYAFWWNDTWLKIGKVGPKSAARYTSQHYNPKSSNSNLAKSLINDQKMIEVAGIDVQNSGDWLKKSTYRVNILISLQRRKELLSFLEAFLHVRLNPKYEG